MPRAIYELKTRRRRVCSVHGRIWFKIATFLIANCGDPATLLLAFGWPSGKIASLQVPCRDSLTLLLGKQIANRLRSVHPLQHSWYPSSTTYQWVYRIGIRSDEFKKKAPSDGSN